MKKIILFSLIITTALSASALGVKKFNKKRNNVKWRLSDEGMSFTTARAVQSDGSISWTNLRFGMVNLGIQRHQTFGRRIGNYTALDLKNVGIADNDGTNRYRYNGYYLGLSTAIKFILGASKSRNKHLVMPGVGLDCAFASKFKDWSIGDKRDSKIKDINYFSDVQLNPWNPYVFLGYKFGNAGIKVSYYTNNYFANTYTSQKVNAINFTLLLSNSSSTNAVKKSKRKSTNTK
jgi:hypothetical protein